MAGKVFHVSDEVHAAVKSWCDQHGLRPKDWVEQVVMDALSRRVTSAGAPPAPVNDRPPAKPEKKVDAIPVERKPVPMEIEATGEKPWELPPFWARPKDKGEDDVREAEKEVDVR